MNKLEQEANNWMKERKMMSSITATEYQIRAAETAIFPKEKALIIALIFIITRASLKKWEL